MHLTEQYFAQLRQMLPELQTGAVVLHAPSQLREGPLRTVTWYAPNLTTVEQGYVTLHLASLLSTAAVVKAEDGRQFFIGVLGAAHDAIQTIAGTVSAAGDTNANTTSGK